MTTKFKDIGRLVLEPFVDLVVLEVKRVFDMCFDEECSNWVDCGCVSSASTMPCRKARPNRVYKLLGCVLEIVPKL